MTISAVQSQTSCPIATTPTRVEITVERELSCGVSLVTFICRSLSPRERIVHILWIIFIGFVAGAIARFLTPGPAYPHGFVFTILLGIVGAFVATYLGHSLGWYRIDQGAGLIGATVGAVLVLFIWNRMVVTNTIGDPGVRPRSWL
jgi:uncharacterized membrane protein YeaQ/YmgE (transglycosylase-associated protein family)